MALTAFTFLVAAGATDERLLRDAAVPLPLVEKTELPLSAFFLVVGWLIAILHAELLLHLQMLSQKLHRVNDSLFGAIRSEREDVNSQIANFTFSNWLIGHSADSVFRRLQGAVVCLTVIVVPIAIHVYALLCFLPAQIPTVTWSQRLALSCTVLLTVLLWPSITDPTKGRLQWWLSALPGRRLRRAFIRRDALASERQAPFARTTLVTCLASTFCAFFMALIPGESLEAGILRVHAFFGGSNVVGQEAYHFTWLGIPVITRHPGFASFQQVWPLHGEVPIGMTTYLPTALLFHNASSPFRRTIHLSGSHRLNTRNDSEWFSPTESTPGSAKNATETRFEGIELQGRSLRYARFSGLHLVGANLADADLTGANFRNVRLDHANLSRIIAPGAELWRSSLYQTNLSEADLAGAILADLNIREAFLDSTRLVSATIKRVSFDASSIVATDFSLAFLYSVRFRGSNVQAGFRGSLLRNVRISANTAPATNPYDWSLAIRNAVLVGPISTDEAREVRLDGSRASLVSDEILIAPDGPLRQYDQMACISEDRCSSALTDDYVRAYLNLFYELACSPFIAADSFKAMIIGFKRGWVIKLPEFRLQDTSMIYNEPSIHKIAFRELESRMRRDSCQSGSAHLTQGMAKFL